MSDQLREAVQSGFSALLVLKIDNLIPPLAQAVGKMAHGGENQRNLEFIVRHILGLISKLRHQNMICIFI